jgi:hypothetical protein
MTPFGERSRAQCATQVSPTRVAVVVRTIHRSSRWDVLNIGFNQFAINDRSQLVRIPSDALRSLTFCRPYLSRTALSTQLVRKIDDHLASTLFICVDVYVQQLLFQLCSIILENY